MTNSGERLDAVVAEAVAGDRDALREVLEIIRPIVVRYCRARVGATERSGLSADDVAQEVCLAAITALPRYKDQGRPFLAFVYGIAAHKVADAHRAAGRNRSDPTDVVPERLSLDAGPEQMALDAESSARMNKLLAVLPEKQREILILRVVVGHERRGDRRGGRQHRRRGPGRAAPRTGAAEGRDHGDGAWPCLTSDAGQPTGAIRRSTRSTAPTGSSTRSRASSRCTRRTPARPSSPTCSPDGATRSATPPLTAPVTPRDAVVALDERAAIAAAQPAALAVVGSAAAAVLCLGGFVSVVAGAGPGDALYGLRTMMFGEQQAPRDDAVMLASQRTRRGAAADRRRPVGCRPAEAADADDDRRDGE